jgi:hypothetical protein
VVASKRNYTWKSLAVLGWSLLLRIGRGGTGKDRVVTFLNLVKGPGVIVPVKSVI